MNRSDLQDAEAKLRALLRNDPAHVSAIHDLGILAHQDGRSSEALHLLKQATRMEAKNAAILKSYGQILRESGDAAGAARIFQQALELEPHNAAVWNALGVCHQESGEPARAMEAYLSALMFDPQSADVLNNIGIVLLHEKDVTAAIEHLEQAVAIKGDYADAHINLGVAYRAHMDYVRATEHFRKAAALKPESSNIMGGLGEILSLVYDPQSEEVLRRAVVLAPQSAERHWNLALDLLRRGDYLNGWAEHEWRWRRGDGHNTPREFSQPYWLGDDIRSKTLLIHAEQGFGDTLQMLRYLPLAQQRAGRVVLEVQPELHRLISLYFAAHHPEIAVLARGASLPPFDVHIAMMSLPLAFKTTLTNIPPPLRLTPPAAERKHPRPLRIGLAWAGNKAHARDRERSLRLDQLHPLFAVPECTWISLQTSEALHQIDAAEASMEYPVLSDFADTAAVLDTLDVVISVDSAVAHLAASQGIPTWILLPYVADWRWLQPELSKNPWYPNARIFRQKLFPFETDQRLRWEPVVRRVEEALHELVTATGLQRHDEPSTHFKAKPDIFP